MNTLALFFLVSIAFGGVVWVFAYPHLSGERKTEKRREFASRTAAAPRTAAVSRGPTRTRREQIEGTLRELEARAAKTRSASLATRITQAGLTWSNRQYMVISATLGIGSFLLFLLLQSGLLTALAIGFAAGFGLPMWILSFLKNRREAKFLAGFPDAVDVIVRGIKSGLPLLESLKIIGQDAAEPIRSEFRTIMETQAIGIPIGEACAKLYERMPIPEANFFGIVITIQQKSGGNLSEALGNLSKVLRERKKMRQKIQAMSMEAKASAGIIGCLPVAVMILVWLSSPQYIALLWTHPTGRLMLACCVFWMGMGILAMRKMINFDF
jgi:tight adherence protein B